MCCRFMNVPALIMGETQEEYIRVLNGLRRKYLYQDGWIARLLTKLEGLA